MNKVINGIYELNADEQTRELIRLRKKAELDSFLALEYAKDEAREKGHAEGHAEGRAEGHAEGRAEGHAEGLKEGLAEGRVEGLKEGRPEGLKEGRAEGKLKGKLEEKKSIAKALKLANVAIDIIVSSTGLSKEEIENL